MSILKPLCQDFRPFDVDNGVCDTWRTPTTDQDPLLGGSG